MGENGVLKEFLNSETCAGIFLVIATIFALSFANLNLTKELYTNFINFEIPLFGHLIHHKQTVQFWINDFFMAIFFFLVGLELKREVYIGQLKNFSQILLPSFAAIGGVLFPALIYLLFNFNNGFALHGWAIPTATDIAFSIGVLALLGSRVPTSLKIFILTLAIIDDLCAILIIALFYGSTLNFIYFSLAILTFGALILLNRFDVKNRYFYIALSLILWFFTLNSGIHATIAGVLAAFTIPITNKKLGKSLLIHLEHALVKPVNLSILPIFAFVNAGIFIRDIDLAHLAHPVSLGIICGLFFGKQIGIFLFSFILIKLKLAKLPENSNFKQLYGVCIICGIGFTMALFVDSLAFAKDPFAFLKVDTLAILIGSLLSGVTGYFFLKANSKPCQI